MEVWLAFGISPSVQRPIHLTVGFRESPEKGTARFTQRHSHWFMPDVLGGRPLMEYYYRADSDCVSSFRWEAC